MGTPKLRVVPMAISAPIAPGALSTVRRSRSAKTQAKAPAACSLAMTSVKSCTRQKQHLLQFSLPAGFGQSEGACGNAAPERNSKKDH